MNSITAFASRLAKDEQGAALVEYGLLIGVIAVGSIAIMTAFRGNIGTMFTNIGAKLTGTLP